MEELSLVIQQPERFLTHITWNKDELKQFVLQKTADYQNVVYTEDALKGAKADRAYLNKLKKAISDRRIEVKKAIMAPYDEFEADVKEILMLIEKPIDAIDTQIKAYETQQKEARKQALKDHYDTAYSESFRSMVPFEKILTDKMLLSSKSEKKAISELDAVEQKINTDLVTIDMGVEERDRTYAHQRYLDTFDVGAVFREIHALAERRKQEEAARLAQMAQNAPEEPQAITSSPERTERQIDVVVDAQEGVSHETSPEVPWMPETEEKIYVSHFAAYGTKTQLYALRDFMVSNNIRFEAESARGGAA